VVVDQPNAGWLAHQIRRVQRWGSNRDRKVGVELDIAIDVSRLNSNPRSILSAVSYSIDWSVWNATASATSRKRLRSFYELLEKEVGRVANLGPER